MSSAEFIPQAAVKKQKESGRLESIPKQDDTQTLVRQETKIETLTKKGGKKDRVKPEFEDTEEMEVEETPKTKIEREKDIDVPLSFFPSSYLATPKKKVEHEEPISPKRIKEEEVVR